MMAGSTPREAMKEKSPYSIGRCSVVAVALLGESFLRGERRSWKALFLRSLAGSGIG
jgi:hypothetical protein